MRMTGAEQLSLSRLIEVTVDDFDESLKAWKFFLLALHSNVHPNELARQLAKSRGSRVLDRRRVLDGTEIEKRDYLEQMAESATEYLSWIREREFQPAIRNLMVAQCVGFENFLKTIGVASQLVVSSNGTMDKLIFVPSNDFRNAHKTINDWWNQRRESRVKSFIEKYVFGNEVLIEAYSGCQHLDINIWAPIWDEIFRLRNAIVHSRGRPSQQVEIGTEIFSPFDEALVTELTLKRVDEAFRVVVNCFRLSLDDI